MYLRICNVSAENTTPASPTSNKNNNKQKYTESAITYLLAFEVHGGILHGGVHATKPGGLR